MIPSSTLTVLDGTIITDLEDAAFKIGVAAGVSPEVTVSQAFLQIAQEFLEFAAPELSYSVIGYLNPKHKQLFITTPFSEWNPTKTCINLIQEQSQLKAKRLEATSIQLMPQTPLPPNHKDISHCCINTIDLHGEHLGYICIFTTDFIQESWNAMAADEILLRLLQIIVKVSRLVEASESQLSNLIHHIGDGIILLSPEQRIKLINPMAKSMLGLNKPMDNQLESFILSIFRPHLQEFHRRNELVSQEINFKYPVERTLKIDIADLEKGQGSLILLRDITHYKEVDRMKTEIISTVSHELRTPLTAIDSMTSNLLRGIGGPLNEKTTFYLDRIRNNSRRLSNLINNLLDLSKLESGETPLYRDFFASATLIERVLQDLEAKLKARNIQTRVQIQKNMPLLFADPQKMDQVLINLIGNAIKFVNPGGLIEVKAKARKEEFSLHIIDNGPGIPATDQEAVFQKFKQVGRVFGAGEKGTGLGLTICAEIVRLHDGQVTVHSPPKSRKGQGTEFIIHLPRKNVRAILHDLVRDKFKQFGSQADKFTLVHIRFQSRVSIQDRLDDPLQAMDNIIKAIQAVIKKDMDSAHYFPEQEAICILLLTDKKGAHPATKRIRKAILSQLKVFPRLKRIKIDLDIQSKCYPDDFEEIETCIDHFFQ